MKNQTIEQFTTVLSSKEPVPGGGGASALVGALGVSLGSMVANLTTGKKKYAEYEEDIQQILAESATLTTRLLDLMNEDAKAFEPLSKAYGLPRGTQEEMEIRNQVMEEALLEASLVPIQIMKTILTGIAQLEELVVKGSKIALSDVGVGAAFLRSALHGASLNVFINTKLMKNREKAEELNGKADMLIAEGSRRIDKVYEMVVQAIR